MERIHIEESDTEQRPDELKIRRIVVNLGNVFVRLTAADRKKVLRILEKVAYGKTGTTFYWDCWSEDDMRACHRQLKPISQKMAYGWSRWASLHLKAACNNRLAMKRLVDELVCRTWIEEP